MSNHEQIERSYNYLPEPMNKLTAQILAITSDLFFQSRIMELATSLGKTARIVLTENDLIKEAGSSMPELVILDLASTEYDPFSCARSLKELASPPKILGILPHVRTDLRTRAYEIGIDYVVPNSSFLKTLKGLFEKGDTPS